ncbi:hypothetical protein [Jannaschia pohangensis]|nr:hypothetical protein [Jannaschia pohangensis]
MRAFLVTEARTGYGTDMKRVHDLSDHAFLPWRFFGRAHGATARG